MSQDHPLRSKLQQPLSAASEAAGTAHSEVLPTTRLGSLPASPSELYEELFEDVQHQAVFEDSKVFVDALAKHDPRTILRLYREFKVMADFDLAAFVREHFSLPECATDTYRSDPNEDVRHHIDRLWGVLTRESSIGPPHSSRLLLPRPYVVPGGRFDEIYYWDSYFTMLGLIASGELELARYMCENCAHLLAEYGLIPNGNRTYYLTRSQPPVFALMVELLAKVDGPAVYARYREALCREYAFWMDGAEALAPGEAYRRVVRLSDGTLLARYWDDRDTPREESYREDIATAVASGRPPAEVYRNIRAGAESGWDFSSRWLADGRSLGSIETTEIAPVDLNCFLFRLELVLARAYAVAMDPSIRRNADRFRQAAEARKAAICRSLWDASEGTFVDVYWRSGSPTSRQSAAMLVPLFVGVASVNQARWVAVATWRLLLASHGLLTTPMETGQQWDAPNGWAPLQWMAIKGLHRYRETGLADTITQRWIALNLAVFWKTGKLVEKYDVTNDDAAATGGEYPLQDGFGWTNGILRTLLQKSSDS